MSFLRILFGNSEKERFESDADADNNFYAKEVTWEIAGMSKEFRRRFEDSEEGPYLARCVLATDDKRASSYASYALYLNNRRDPLGELLALYNEAHSGNGTSESSKRIIELRAEFDPVLCKAITGTDNLRNCGLAKNDVKSVRFAYKCPNSWADLEVTGQSGVRHCTQCEERVYQCKSRDDVEHHASEGHCVYLPLQIVNDPRNTPLEGYLGRPDRNQIWAEQFLASDE